MTIIHLKKHAGARGDILFSVLIFAAIAVTMTIGLTNWGAAMLGGIRNAQAREQAFQIAEAGVDYYQWHLAQYPTDYKDGTNGPGPYVHQFYDKDGNLLGSYSLTITAPPVGSTIVKVVSKGTIASSTISRTIQVVMGIPSLAKYAAVADDNMRFGAGTEVFGPVHSNKGIRFDGFAHNLVSSAMATYTDPDSGSCTSSNSWGVHTCVSPADPNANTPMASRPDVFSVGRQVSVPAVDFAGLTANLSSLQALAQASAGGKEFTASHAQGYHIVLRTDGKYDVYKVNALQAAPNNCTNDSNQTQWGTWSIKSPISSNQTLVTGSPFTYPTNGVIFVDDHVWVDGQVNNTRLTIAAGIIGSTDPAQYSNITVNSDLLYTNYNGLDAVGLVAQGNVNVGLVSDDNLEVDAALVAENGRVGRFYYNSNCRVNSTNYYDRSSITLLGMIATEIRYGFAYTDGTGYDTRNINYDANLLYGPPPSFPLATTQYQMISWQELPQ